MSFFFDQCMESWKEGEGMRFVIAFSYLTLKRLFRKTSFLILLLMMPVAAFLLYEGGKSDSSVMQAGIVYDSEDGVSRALASKLINESSAISFTEIADEAEGYKLVKEGVLDCVYVLREGMSDLILENIKKGTSQDYMLLITREENIKSKMGTMKLWATLYPEVLEIYYEDYVVNGLGLSQEESRRLLEDYKGVISQNDLIKMVYIGDVDRISNTEDTSEEGDEQRTHGKQKESMNAKSSYVTAPVKGILSAFVVLLGFSANLYYLWDEKNGVLGLISPKKRFGVSMIYLVIPMLCGVIVSFITMVLFGMAAFSLREVLNLLLLVVSATGFCTVIREALGNHLLRMGVALPFLMIWMVIICPVFVNIKRVRAASYFFPVGAYLMADGLWRYSIFMLLYGVVLVLCAWGIMEIREK